MSENFKISEIARLFGISSDTLRFYEKKGLLKPSVNEQNHYRSYELTDINLLIDILFYRRLDLSLQDIHTILYQGDLDQLQQTLTIKEAEIKAQIEEQKLILKKLALTAQNVDEIKAAMGEVKIQPMPAYYVLLRGKNEMAAYRKSKRIFASDIFDVCQLVGVYHQQNDWIVQSAFMILLEKQMEDEFHLLKDKTCPLLEETDLCARILMKFNDHKDIKAQIEPLFQKVKQQGYQPTGTIYINYMLAVSETDASEYYSEILIPVK